LESTAIAFDSTASPISDKSFALSGISVSF